MFEALFPSTPARQIVHVGGATVDAAAVIAIAPDLAPVVDPERAAQLGPCCWIVLDCGERLVARCDVDTASTAIFGEATDDGERAHKLATLGALVHFCELVGSLLENRIAELGGQDTRAELNAFGAAANAFNGTIARLPEEHRDAFARDVITNLRNRELRPDQRTPLGPFPASYDGATVEQVATLILQAGPAKFVDPIEKILNSRKPAPASNAPDVDDDDGIDDAGPAGDSDDDSGAPVVA